MCIYQSLVTILHGYIYLLAIIHWCEYIPRHRYTHWWQRIQIVIFHPKTKSRRVSHSLRREVFSQSNNNVCIWFEKLSFDPKRRTQYRIRLGRKVSTYLSVLPVKKCLSDCFKFEKKNEELEKTKNRETSFSVKWVWLVSNFQSE